MSRPSYTTYTTPRRRRWKRILLAFFGTLVILVLAFAGGAYLWLNHVVGEANSRLDEGTRSEIEQAIGEKPSTSLVDIAEPEDAMNIMLVGGDARESGDVGRSDSLMLVHVDPTNNYMSMLSIPRDLWVNIPGRGDAKINAAYAYGGPALAIKTVQEVTGVDIDKYVEIDMEAFKDLTDALGGVYVDVDHRYYYGPDSNPRIDLQAGYQLLDGEKALAYSRFRYDQNLDFGRSARQQRILIGLKEQAAGWDMTLKLPGLVSSFFDHVGTNLGTNDVMQLGYFVARLGGGNVRQVRITATTGMVGDQSVVKATQEAIKQAVTDYLTVPGGESKAGASTGSAPSAACTEVAMAPASLHYDPVAAKPVVALAANGGILDKDRWTALQAAVPFPLQAPGALPEGYSYYQQNPAQPGTYNIKVGGGTKPAVKVVYRYKSTDLYIGVSATTWIEAPIAGPGSEVKGDNGVTYTVVYNGGKADHIWWRSADGSVLYFISNTIFCTVERDELLAMAKSMTPVSGTSAT